MSHYDDLRFEGNHTAQKEAQLDTECEEGHLGLFKQVHCYLPSLDGFLEIGNGYDQQSAKEDYLLKLEDFITVLHQNVEEILYEGKNLTYFGGNDE